MPTEQLPRVAWANGGCVNDGTPFGNFLTEIASYGYLVIAIGPLVAQPVDDQAGKLPPPTDRTQPPPGPLTRHSRQLTDAINWASRENERPASPCFHHLDLAHVAYIGGRLEDVAFANASDAFGGLARAPALRAWRRGVPHAGTYHDNAGGAEEKWRRAAPAHQLKGSSAAPAITVRPVIGGTASSLRYIAQRKQRYRLRATPYQAAVDLLRPKPAG